MSDRIVYTAKLAKGEFNQQEGVEVASFSKDTLGKGEWASLERDSIEAHVVDTLKTAKEVLKSLTPIEKLCILHEIKTGGIR